MNQLLIDTAGALDQFKRLEHTFDFYPAGFVGLISDMLNYHMSNPDSSEDADQMFMDTVLEAYYTSTKYQATSASPEDPAIENLIALALLMINHTTMHFVRYHRNTLSLCEVDSQSIELGSSFEYILLKRK
jgi:hypothetical protein